MRNKHPINETSEDTIFQLQESDYEEILQKRFASNPDAAYNYLRSAELASLDNGENTLNDSFYQIALELVAKSYNLQKYQIRELFMEGRETWNRKLEKSL